MPAWVAGTFHDFCYCFILGRTLFHQEYISIESMQLPETAFLHIDVTSSSANPISGGVAV